MLGDLVDVLLNVRGDPLTVSEIVKRSSRVSQSSFDRHKDDLADYGLIEDAELGSIGVTVRFEFDFHNLKGALMDVGTFSQFLREGLQQEFNVRNVTESRFTVGTLENDLTLDEWIQERRFEASLLLKDERGERSIEFHGDQAVITAPYPEVTIRRRNIFDSRY